MVKKLIYFVRHGETESNFTGIRQGKEGHLTEQGREQAHAVAGRFPKKKGAPEVIIASPYERTRETAEIIANELKSVLKLPVEYSPLLAERRNPTEIIGHSDKEERIKNIVDRIDKSFHADNLRYSDEENFIDLKNRAERVLEFIKNRKEKKIIMVTHSRILKMIVSYMLLEDKLTASEYNKLSFLNPIENGGITICSYNRYLFNFKKEEWKLIVWNDLIQGNSVSV